MSSHYNGSKLARANCLPSRPEGSLRLYCRVSPIVALQAHVHTSLVRIFDSSHFLMAASHCLVEVVRRDNIALHKASTTPDSIHSLVKRRGTFIFNFCAVYEYSALKIAYMYDV